MHVGEPALRGALAYRELLPDELGASARGPALVDAAVSLARSRGLTLVEIGEP